jgi:hypothetical protein
MTTVVEAAKQLSVTPGRVRKYIAEGRLKAVPLDCRVRRGEMEKHGNLANCCYMRFGWFYLRLRIRSAVRWLTRISRHLVHKLETTP